VKRSFCCCIAVLIALAGSAVASTAVASAAEPGTISEFSAGLGGNPAYIVAGPDGNLWFVDDGTTPAIGRITVVGSVEPSGGSTPPPPAGSTPSNTPPPVGAVTLSRRTITVKANGTASIPLLCTGTATCKGTVELAINGGPATHEARAARKAKATVVGKTKFSIAPGEAASVKVKVNATGRALLKAHRDKLAATLTVKKFLPSPATTTHKTVHIVQRGAK
jgi:hypothetical protein